MKKILKLGLMFSLVLQIKISNAQLGVGTMTPDSSSILDLTSTSKGLLAPRMTTVNRNAITLPATGLLIYNTTTSAFEVNTGTPAIPAWLALATSGSQVQSSRLINTDLPLSGGGNLSADRTLSIDTLTAGGVATKNDISVKESTANKDASNGYAGMTSFKINFKNSDNTFTSFFTNANLASRTYTFQDRDGTIADNTDLALKANLASPTFTGTPALPTGTTGVTQTAGNSTTALATTAFVTTADNLKANLASPTFTGTPAGPTATAGTNTTQLATTAFVETAVPNASYRTILECSGSHTAGKVAGTYALGQGDPIAISGTGTLYPINTIYIAAADYPAVDGKAAKLRIRAQLYSNNVAPTGNYTLGLYPITRPATSGGAALNIYTLGTVVAGSNGTTFTTPAADGLLNAVSSDFSLPADGNYVIGVVTTATVVTNSHLHITASLQMRNN